ncbi:MAG: nitrous oxide reductase family maturation protein NosD [Gemmatimonadales bacterium]|nr:MAG: nitrous oxide reductase family maturation protein NosD [Gemmatimonadales bacterium]
MKNRLLAAFLLGGLLTSCDPGGPSAFEAANQAATAENAPMDHGTMDLAASSTGDFTSRLPSLATPQRAVRAPTTSPSVLVVDAAGPLSSIGDAVRAAAPGSRIIVKPGLYAEPTIVVDRSVTTQGEGYPTIDGEGLRQIFTVTANDVRITGLDLRNVGVSYVEDRAAIRVEGAARCEIDHNRIHGGFFAIYLARATDCRISENRIAGTGTRETDSGNGIHAWNSKRLVVESNEVRGHRDGIYFEFVEDSRVSRNLTEGNIRYGLHFMFSDGCRYLENTFRGNGAGVAVMYTSDIEMLGNRFENNQGSAAFGLLLKDISDSRILNNTFQQNSVGLYAEGFDRTEVSGNDFVRNGRAIRLFSNSVDTDFIDNNFIGNTFDVTTNSRRVHSSFEGNHWDGYAGYDLDGDGVGDLPHHPVRLFALIAERTPVTTVLLRSFFVTLLDWTERVVPSLTPDNLIDKRPAMRRLKRSAA